MVRTASAIAALVLAAACSQGQEPAADPQGEAAMTNSPDVEPVAPADEQPRFDWRGEIDAGGFYLPNTDVTAGDWKLAHIYVGHPMDMNPWMEAGADPAEAPVWMTFEHVDTAYETNELGQEYAVDSKRVRADAFTIGEGAFEFRASDDEIGDILVSGSLNPEYLHEAGGAPQGGGTAITAGAEFGGERIRNLSFMHWLGD